MGLLDRLLKSRRSADAQDGRPLTADEALARWRFLIGKAPPETLAEAHSRALDSLGDAPRAEVLQRLRSGLASLETGVVVPSDPALLIRAAARAERRAPGFLERTLGSDARGRQTLSGLAAAVVASSVAWPFLRGFAAAAETGASGNRRSQELDVDAPAAPGTSSDYHDHDLDDED
jgi:hypothetical protein